MKTSIGLRGEHLAVWFGTTLLLFLIASAVARTEVGKLIEVWSFGFLQSFLNPFEPKGLPVVIVDAENLKPQDSGVVITPRPQLENLIKAIAVGRPRAIAVDIDFGMKDGDFRLPNDPMFFDNVLGISKKHDVPIFLAIDKTIDGTSGGPLGLVRWDAMAVGAYGKDAKGFTVAVPFWYVPAEYEKPLPNLPVAVALAYLKGPEIKRPPFGIGALVEAIDIAPPVDTSGVSRRSWIGQSVVNYSKMAQLFNERIRIDHPFNYIPRDSVEGKIVIIGNANPKHTVDQFRWPMQDDVAAGVMFQGAASYTLAVEPVYELKAGVRVTLDFLFSFAGFLFLTRKVGKTRVQNELNDVIPVDQKVAIATALVVLLIGIALVVYSHVIWLDFVVVATSLALHPFFANIFERWQRRRRMKIAEKGAS